MIDLVFDGSHFFTVASGGVEENFRSGSSIECEIILAALSARAAGVSDAIMMVGSNF